MKKHDRSIRNKTQLLKLLRREAPHHAYTTTSQFRNPAEVGPDQVIPNQVGTSTSRMQNDLL